MHLGSYTNELGGELGVVGQNEGFIERFGGCYREKGLWKFQD